MKCSQLRPDNSYCQAYAMTESAFCFSHNPATAEAKKEAVMKGGLSLKKHAPSLPPIELTDNKSVVRLISQTINEVRQGQIDLRVANCIGYLAGHLIKALEVADIEERISELEKIHKKA